MKRIMVVWFSLFVCFSLHLPGQVPLEITEAELAIPFGSIDGRLILVGDYLIFLDQDEQRNSFAVTRNQIQGSSGTGANSRYTASEACVCAI